MNEPPLPPNSCLRILVVDDHPDTAMTLARAISELRPDLEVMSATSGQEAVGKVENGPLDVLITDMMMPEMSGMQLIERLESQPAGRPTHIILITAYDLPGLNETARRLNVDETIIKPVRPERVCQIIDDFSRTSHTERQ